MTSICKAAAALLVLLIVLPFTAPFSQCSLTALLADSKAGLSVKSMSSGTGVPSAPAGVVLVEEQDKQEKQDNDSVLPVTSAAVGGRASVVRRYTLLTGDAAVARPMMFVLRV